MGVVGRIAFVVDGQPVLFPINYRPLRGGHGLLLLLRTRPGNIIDQAPEQVAFEIDGIDSDHHQGWSVLVRGVLHHLDDNAVERFRQQHLDLNPWLQHDRTSWLVVKAQTVTGRRLRAAEHEWRFRCWADF